MNGLISVTREKLNNLIYKLIIFSRVYRNAFVTEKITVKRDAITGSKLNHN